MLENQSWFMIVKAKRQNPCFAFLLLYLRAPVPPYIPSFIPEMKLHMSK